MDIYWKVGRCLEPAPKKQSSPSTIHVQGVSPSGTKFRNLLPKNGLPIPSIAESKPPPWKLSTSTTNQRDLAINVPPTQSAAIPVFRDASQRATVTPTVQPFASPTLAVTPQNSTTTSLNNLLCLNPGITPGIRSSNVNILDNGTSSPVIVPGSSNFIVTTMNNRTLEKVVSIAAPSLPSYTPQNSFVSVPIQARSLSIPSTSVPQKFVMTSPSMGTTSLTPSNNFGTSSAAKQPQNLSRQNASPSLGNCTEAKKTNNRSRPLPMIAPKPLRLRNVIMPKTQPDGTVRLEKTIVFTNETDDRLHEENQPKGNGFILREVSNDFSETGVAKKFVVFPANAPVSAPVRPLSSTVAVAPKAIETADTSAASTSFLNDLRASRTNRGKRKVKLRPPKKSTSPASSLVSTKQCDADPRIPVDCSSGSGEREWQWHHPYSGEPPSPAKEPNTTEDSVSENDPVNISNDDGGGGGCEQPEHKTSSATPIAGVSDAVDDLVFISDDDDEKPAFETPSQPIDGVHRKDDNFVSIPDYDAQPDEKKPCLPDSSVYGYTPSYTQECSKKMAESQNLSYTPFELHEPCTNDANAGDRSGMSKDSGARTQPQNTKVEFEVEHDMMDEFSTDTNSAMEKIATKKLKKDNKKKRRAQFRKKISALDSSSVLEVPSSISDPSFATSLELIDQITMVDPKIEIQCVPTSSQPDSSSENMDLSSVGASISNSEQSSFKWHHPTTETFQGKSEESGVAWHSEFKIETASLSGAENEHVEVPLLLGSEPNARDTQDVTEQRYRSRSFAGELKTEDEKNIPWIDPDSSHSILPLENRKSSAYHADQFNSSMVFDNELEDVCSVENVPEATSGSRCHQMVNPGKKLNKLLIKLKRKLEKNTEGINSSNAFKPKRILVGGPDTEHTRVRENRKIQKMVTLTSMSSSNCDKEKHSSTDLKDSPKGKIVKPSVLRDCIVKKAIQDSYSEGLIPTVERIHKVCCESGLEFQKDSVEPHLHSIGYNWVKCNAGRLPVEDHRITTGRIKYLKKLEKYQDRNFVYIFVSEVVKKTDTGWEVILDKNNVGRSGLHSARVVLHAMSSKRLLECSLKVLKVGLFGLKHKDIVSWLECRVIPNVPKGSVVVLGNHSIFDKNEELGERPDINYSKERIVSWLTNHKVTSIDPTLPKAILLSKVDNVILPKSCVFDRLIRQNGLVPLHLPKHHKDLNPIEFLWCEILEKLYKSEEGFEDFVTREFSSCPQLMSAVACNLVRRFESSYREFDLRFDEFYEKVVSALPPEKPHSPSCPVCLRQMKMLGFRCFSCRTFWRRLGRIFKQSPANLPVCRNKKHIIKRPPKCEGCRRYRYELAQLQRPHTKKKGFILPIPPVTKEGKPYSPCIKSK